MFPVNSWIPDMFREERQALKSWLEKGGHCSNFEPFGNDLRSISLAIARLLNSVKIMALVKI